MVYHHIRHIQDHSPRIECVGGRYPTADWITGSISFSLLVAVNSSHYFYITLKLITLFSVVSLLYTSEVFFENIFLIRPWKALFVNTDDSIKEWWFRWKIDRYVSVVLLGVNPANQPGSFSP